MTAKKVSKKAAKKTVENAALFLTGTDDEVRRKADEIAKNRLKSVTNLHQDRRPKQLIDAYWGGTPATRRKYHTAFIQQEAVKIEEDPTFGSEQDQDATEPYDEYGSFNTREMFLEDNSGLETKWDTLWERTPPEVDNIQWKPLQDSTVKGIKKKKIPPRLQKKWFADFLVFASKFHQHQMQFRGQKGGIGKASKKANVHPHP